MINNILQKTITATGKTRAEAISLLESAKNELQTLLFPAEGIYVAATWEAKTYKKIKEISFANWREAISCLKSFYFENAALTKRTGQTSLVSIAKTDVYNFDFSLWKNTKLFGLDSMTFFDSVADLLAVTESGDNYVFECFSPELEKQDNNIQFAGLFTPYKPLTGAEQLIYDMAMYDNTATDADRQALGIKTEKLKEYSYTKEKGDSEAFSLSYPENIIKRIAALRKKQVPFIS